MDGKKPGREKNLLYDTRIMTYRNRYPSTGGCASGDSNGREEKEEDEREPF